MALHIYLRGHCCARPGQPAEDNATSRKVNTSPTSIDDKEALKKPLTDPLVKKIDLRFPTGLEVTARNMKGVTIKDALDAIHKQLKKKVTLSRMTCGHLQSVLGRES